MPSSIVRRGIDQSRRRLHQASKPRSPVQITTLPNKVRVATVFRPAHFSSIGLYVDAGSRYETPSTSGVSHFIDRMAFKSTTSRTTPEMSAAIDALGGQIMSASSRDSIMYQSSHFHEATPLALSLISDTILNPSFLPEELDAERDAARYELRELAGKPDMFLPEILHNVAYGGKTLGNPLLCPEDRVDAINEGLLRSSMKEWYRPERMVVAGLGMQHEELVELAEKYFSNLKPAPAPSPSSSTSRQIPPGPPQPPLHLLPSSSPSIYKSLTRAASSYFYPTNSADPPSVLSSFSKSRSTYIGGHRFIHDPNSEYNHIYVAFEGVGVHDRDIYTLATMQVLLGGGGSFSAGGPGKGMYSRLYSHILNHFHQIDHCAAFHHIYTDSSLFGLFASFSPAISGQRGSNRPPHVLPHLIHQLSLLLYSPIPERELTRAKNQLKSTMMMALESQAVEVEDLGRQILAHGRTISISEMTDRIDEVTTESIRQVASRIFGRHSGNKATIVAMGREDVDDWEAVLRKYGVGG